MSARDEIVDDPDDAPTLSTVVTMSVLGLLLYASWGLVAWCCWLVLDAVIREVG